jgi:hypothetical protein
MPRKISRNADVRQELEHQLTALEVNEAELPHFEVTRQTIRGVLTTIRESSIEQDRHQASKQEASKRHQAAQDEGRKLITTVQVMLRQHYGNRSEKLAEFGIQPFRGRTRPATVESKPQKPLPPASPSAPAVQEAKAGEVEELTRG